MHLFKKANYFCQVKLVINSEVLDHCLQLTPAYHFHFYDQLAIRLKCAQEFGGERTIRLWKYLHNVLLSHHLPCLLGWHDFRLFYNFYGQKLLWIVFSKVNCSKISRANLLNQFEVWALQSYFRYLPWRHSFWWNRIGACLEPWWRRPPLHGIDPGWIWSLLLWHKLVCCL